MPLKPICSSGDKYVVDKPLWTMQIHGTMEDKYKLLREKGVFEE